MVFGMVWSAMTYERSMALHIGMSFSSIAIRSSMHSYSFRAAEIPEFVHFLSEAMVLLSRLKVETKLPASSCE